jgi:hypothetical protein
MVQNVMGEYYGQVVNLGAGYNYNSWQMNSGLYWNAASFLTLEAKTLSKIMFYISVITGNPTSLTCQLQTSSSNFPSGVTLETIVITPVVGWNEVVGFSTALTAGTLYWIVLKNTSSTPTSNYMRVAYMVDFYRKATHSGCWRQYRSNDGGTGWSGYENTASFRVEYSDGAFDGATVTPGGELQNEFYGVTEIGVKFRTPSIKLRVVGAFLPVYKSGTLPSRPFLKLYNDTSLLSTTNILPGSIANTYHLGYFPSVIELPINTIIRLTARASGGDGDGTNHLHMQSFGVKDDAIAQTLLPFHGIIKTTFDGATWVDTPTSTIGFSLLLDHSNLFGS